MDRSLRQKVSRTYGELVQQREFDLPGEEEVKEAMPLPVDFREQIMIRKRRDEKYIIVWGRRVSKVAVLIIALLATGVTVYAVWRTRLLFKIFERNTAISSIEEELESGREYLDHIYYPVETMGFEIEDQVQMGTQLFTTYRNGVGETLTFLQQVIQTQYLFDNENTEEESVEVGGGEAVCFSKYGESTLIWCEHGYLFELTAPDRYRDNLISIAESLELQEERSE